MQRYRAVILIVLFGVVPVVAAFFVALSFLQDEEASSGAAVPVPAVVEAPAPPLQPPAEKRSVLAAMRVLPVGTLLGAADVAPIEIELASVRDEHVLVREGTGSHLLRGFAVREELALGEAIGWSAVVGPDQRGFLATVLRPGMRALTIQVGPATGHAGLVDPGDRVDVILSAELELPERQRAVLADTIVEDVRVLAVDRVVANGAGPSGGEAKLERTEIVTATLEVTPGQGSRLVLGGHEGVLSLAVRSLADSSTPVSDSAVEIRDLLSPRGEGPAEALEQRLRAEIELLEQRLREEEEERHQLEEARRIRLEEELAQMEERLREEMASVVVSPEEDVPELKSVRILRGSTAAEDVVFGVDR